MPLQELALQFPEPTPRLAKMEFLHRGTPLVARRRGEERRPTPRLLQRLANVREEPVIKPVRELAIPSPPLVRPFDLLHP